jgi:hypothetical protein
MYFLVHDIDAKHWNSFLVFSLIIKYCVLFSCILCVAEMIHITVIFIVDKFSIALLVAFDNNKVNRLYSIFTFL